MDTEPANQDDTDNKDLQAMDVEPATGGAPDQVPDIQSATADSPDVPPQFPVSTPPKKPRHLLRNLIIGLVVLIVLAIAAVVVWKSIQPKSVANQSPATAVQTDDTAQSIVAKITTAITDKSSKNYQESQVQQTSPFTSPLAVSPSYKVPGANYYVTIDKAYGITATDSVNSADTTVNQTFTKAIIDQAAATLTSNHYIKTSTTAYSTEYQSDNVVCSVSTPDSLPVSVTCANQSDYKSTSDAVKPFAAAYTASPDTNSVDQADNIYTAPIIKNSSVAGYKNAALSISSRQAINGAVLLFYQHGTANWQFFMITQNELNCNQYHTTDEQSAFADEKCINSSGNEVTVAAASQAATPAPAPATTPTSTPAPVVPTGGPIKQ